MKLMDKAKHVEALKALTKELGEEVKDYTIKFKMDDSREEKTGSLTTIFTIKHKTNKKAKEFKIAIYIFESRKSITTFIVNGRTLTLLFENSTINSPDIALHYLRDILLNEVAWVRNLEEIVKKQKDEAAKKRGNKKPQNGSNRGKRPHTSKKPSGNKPHPKTGGEYFKNSKPYVNQIGSRPGASNFKGKPGGKR